MQPLTSPKNRLANLPATALAMSLMLLVPYPVSASGPLSLTGSEFEIESDANLTVDDAGNDSSLDWIPVIQTRKPDAPSGSSDDSFTQGTKENTQVPVISTGSIPPNKSDLKEFGIFEEVTATQEFVHLYWTRVQDPRGTTNMDFEFNQSTLASANGVTTVRTVGDLLIEYKLSRGGTVPQLFRYIWLGDSASGDCEAGNRYPCWGDKTDLTSAGDATGAINSSAIMAANSDDLGPLDPRTFGEASLEKSAFGNGEGECFSFGSAYVKSRSSDSFNSALKDFIAPTPVDIRNCAKVTIFKTLKELTTEVINPFEEVLFTLFDDKNDNGTFDDDDTISVPNKSCTTVLVGDEATCMITDLLPGAYCLKETLPADETRVITKPEPVCFIIEDHKDEVKFNIENTFDLGTA